MLARMSTTHSNPSTLAPTISDTQSIGNICYFKKNSISNNCSSCDENKIQTVEIKIRSSKKMRSESQKPISNTSVSNSNSKSRHRSLKIFDENQFDCDFNLKPILKNKKRNNMLNINFNLADYQGKTIKFSDQVEGIDSPLAEVIIVESYKKYNDEILEKPLESKPKTKTESECRCSIF